MIVRGEFKKTIPEKIWTIGEAPQHEQQLFLHTQIIPPKLEISFHKKPKQEVMIAILGWVRKEG